MFGFDDAVVGAGILGASALGSSAISAASRVSPTSTTHQAKLGLKYGKLYDTWSAQNMPSLNREGMERAGFNPILAITNGQAAHGMPSFSGNGAYESVGDLGFGDAVSSAVNGYFGIKQQRQQLDNMKSQKDMFDTQAELNRRRAELTTAQTQNTDADTFNKRGIHAKNAWELGSKIFDRVFSSKPLSAVNPSVGSDNSAKMIYDNYAHYPPDYDLRSRTVPSDYPPKDRYKLDTGPRKRVKILTPRDEGFEKHVKKAKRENWLRDVNFSRYVWPR